MNQNELILHLIEAQLTHAAAELHALCEGKPFTTFDETTIETSDVILATAINNGGALLSEVTRLHAALQQIANATYARYEESRSDGYYQDGIEEGLRIAADMARKALEDQHGTA